MLIKKYLKQQQIGCKRKRSTGYQTGGGRRSYRWEKVETDHSQGTFMPVVGLGDGKESWLGKRV
jgi:hypothetical protein